MLYHLNVLSPPFHHHLISHTRKSLHPQKQGTAELEAQAMVRRTPLLTEIGSETAVQLSQKFLAPKMTRILRVVELSEPETWSAPRLYTGRDETAVSWCRYTGLWMWEHGHGDFLGISGMCICMGILASIVLFWGQNCMMILFRA